jgi:hypothetical protein
MATLIQIFDQTQGELRQRLKGNTDPEKVVPAVKDYLDTLLDTYRNEEERDPDQKRFAVRVMDVLRSSVSTVVAASETEIWRRNQAEAADEIPRQTNFLNIFFRILQIILAGVILSMLYLENLFAYQGLVGGLVLSELVRALVNFFKRKKREKVLRKLLGKAREIEFNLLRASVLVNTDLLVSILADAILTADKLLEAVLTVKTQSNESGLENDASLLEFFQDLLRANDRQNSEFAFLKIELLPHLLERHGIRAEAYTGTNEHLFEFQESINPKNTTFRTVRLALVKGKRLLKRGLVEEPITGQKTG